MEKFAANDIEPWSIGTIVALKSHPFSTENQSSIFLSGDPQATPPLMVIIESVVTKPHDEDHRNINYKCIWFSSKSFRYEETTISHHLLKVVRNSQSNAPISSTQIGSTVRFSTATIESKKRKASLNYQSGAQSKGSSISAQLNFVAPLMLVSAKIENEKFKQHNPPLKCFSKNLVRCKYFSPLIDKFSEVLLPEECLESIISYSNDEIGIMLSAIENQIDIKIRIIDPNILSIIKPLRLNFALGVYTIDCYDYLSDKETHYDLNEIEIEALEIKPIIELPKYITKGKSIRVTGISKTSLKQLDTRHYWRIRYRDLNHKITNRTLRNCQVVVERQKFSDVSIEYLKGYCRLRKAERCFRLDQIQRIQVLALKIENPKSKKVKKKSSTKAKK